MNIFLAQSFIDNFKDRISKLVVMINGTIGYEYRWRSCACHFAQICMIFTKLTHFHFDVKKNKCPYTLDSLTRFSPTCSSSNIVHLNVQVKTFDDCLSLFDGHFSQLHTLIVYVERIRNTSRIINNTVKCLK